MRRSQVAQAHSTTYHPQTNGLVERQIVGVDAEGILFQIHDRLGQILSTGNWRVQQHATLHHRS